MNTKLIWNLLMVPNHNYPIPHKMYLEILLYSVPLSVYMECVIMEFVNAIMDMKDKTVLF